MFDCICGEGMNPEEKVCPFSLKTDKASYCGKEECMAWREIKTGVWDCVMLVRKA